MFVIISWDPFTAALVIVAAHGAVSALKVAMADFDLDSSFIPALHKPAALLPIAKHRESLLYVVETYPVTIVIGQTGSGKTTQIPQFLESAGWCNDGKVIGITQVSRPSSLYQASQLTQVISHVA